MYYISLDLFRNPEVFRFRWGRCGGGYTALRINHKSTPTSAHDARVQAASNLPSITTTKTI
jgi:hypothetical protein